MDIYGAVSFFLGDWCERIQGSKEPSLRIWEGYLAWCTLERMRPYKPEVFFEALPQDGVEVRNGYARGVRLRAVATGRLAEIERDLEAV